MKKIRTILIPLIVFICISTISFTAEMSSNSSKGIFYKLKTTYGSIYLFGSIHVGTSEMYPLDTKIESAFSESDELGVEINVTDDVISKKLQDDLLISCILPKGDSLKNHISAESYEILSSRLAEINMDISSFDLIKPWALEMAFIPVYQLLAMGYDTKYGVDIHFLDQAKSSNKKVVEVENVDIQLNMLKSFSDSEIDSYIKIIDNYSFDEVQDITEQLVDSWKVGDETVLANLSVTPLMSEISLYPLYKKLYYNRNIYMADKIEKYIKENRKIFIVVGSGHLVGQDSVIDFLKKKGYFLEKI